MKVVDQALELQAPLVRGHVARIMSRNPEMDPADVIKRLNRELRTATIGSGAAVGGSAAAPGIGTAAALALSAGEALGFMNATALYVLARAEVQGISLRDIERRRTLLMAIMLGEAGARSVSQVAERTGQHWARALVSSIPMTRIYQINRVLGPNFVTKYGTTRGIIVLGRVIPFGVGAAIGGGANAVFSHGVIKASDKAFGPAPEPDDTGRVLDTSDPVPPTELH
jgi:hypothetical protein